MGGRYDGLRTLILRFGTRRKGRLQTTERADWQQLWRDHAPNSALPNLSRGSSRVVLRLTGFFPPHRAHCRRRGKPQGESW